MLMRSRRLIRPVGRLWPLLAAAAAFGAVPASLSRAFPAAGRAATASPGDDSVKRTDMAGRAGAFAAAPRPEPTDEVLVFLKPGTDPARFAREQGLAVRYRLRSDPDAYVLAAPNVFAATMSAATLFADRRVDSAYPNEPTRHERMAAGAAFVPDDPYFHRDTPAAGWPGQWHLVNEHVAGLDARVQGAWNRGVTGQGVLIGIVDDSLETAHEDLAPNYVAADSWDFGQNDNNPSPVSDDDQHGVSVAGVAAGRGGNGVGMTGAAPLASLAGLRIDFANQTTAMFVDATLYHSSGANTSIKVKNHSYGVGSPYAATTAERDALATSAAAGTVHCFAAGNERGESGQDANKKMNQASPHAIAVAALGSSGLFASYSSFGANVFVTAPSSSFRSGELGIECTDRSGAPGYNSFPDDKYTGVFGGTSSASPLVAGALALVKQAQPNLNTRFAKHLLARTSDVVDPGDATATSDGGWKTNAAGFEFNQNYGFGKIDADELTLVADDYSGVTPLQTATVPSTSVAAAIPDGSATGVTRAFTLNSTTPLEEVLVTLGVTHAFRGDVEAYLTSPSGTTSRLMIRSGSDGGDDINWTFTSNAFWGENPAGTWTLRLVDTVTGDAGTWNSYAVTARMGTLVAAPAAGITVAPTGGLTTTEAGGAATFTVKLDSQPAADVAIGLSSSDTTEGAVSPASLIFTPVNWSAAQTVMVTGVDDAADDGDVAYSVVTAAATSSDPAYSGRNASDVSATNADDDTAPAPSVEVIVDNATTNTAVGTVARVGTWTTSTGLAGRYGANYLHDGNSGKGSKTVRFTPNLPSAGSYEVSVWYPNNPNGATSVPVDVRHAGGTAAVKIPSQRSGGGTWTVLGTWTFDAGTGGSLTIKNVGTAGYVVADAVRFRSAGGTAPPPAAGPTLSGLTVNPDSVVGGSTPHAVGTVTLSGPAPAGGFAFAAASSDPSAASVAASGAVAAGQTAGQFTVTSYPVTSTRTVTVTVSAGGVSKTATFTVNPPAAGGPAEVILDNGQAALTGTWSTSTALAGRYGTNYLHDGNTGKGSKTARFTPNLTTTGTYQVSVWYPNNPNGATNVPVDVRHAGGTARVTIPSQKSGGGQWVSLGSWSFNAGTGGSVTVLNAGTAGYVIADAVKLVRQ